MFPLKHLRLIYY